MANNLPEELRKALFHLEQAAEILRQSAPHGFSVEMQEISPTGVPMLEKLVVQVLDFEEGSREYGPISGRSIRHSLARDLERTHCIGAAPA